MVKEYNGWKNYETWNVSLWITNDEGLYQMARAAGNYQEFIESLKVCDGGDISRRTPDGVYWNDAGLDIKALDEMLKEL